MEASRRAVGDLLSTEGSEGRVEVRRARALADVDVEGLGR